MHWMKWIVGSVEAEWGEYGGYWKMSLHSFSGRWGDTDCLAVCSGHCQRANSGYLMAEELFQILVNFVFVISFEISGI